MAALLAVARTFAAEGPARRTVVFAAFAAEELGLLGSAHYVAHPPPRCPVERMQLMVNLDMVGRPRQGKLYVHGAATAKGLRDEVRAIADARPRLPLTLAFGEDDGYGPSDHTSFYAKGVPIKPGGPFLREEHALLRVIAERVGSCLAHMKTQTELAEAHRTLRAQHQILQERNITLRSVLGTLEEEKRDIRAAILSKSVEMFLKSVA